MINRVILTGRTTDVPQIRVAQTNNKVANFTLAVNRRFTQPNQQQADFIRCVAFGKLAELIEQYVTKGMSIAVEGRIQTGSYDDPTTGKKVYTTDVVCDNVQFLESKKSNEYQNQSYSHPTQTFVAQESNFSISPDAIEKEPTNDLLGIASDDLPF